MITNKELLKSCLLNMNDIIDDDYQIDKELIIIPRTREEKNELTINCNKLINLFTTISTLNSNNDYSKDSELTDQINEIFVKTEHINFFPFNQYLQTHNITYNIYKENLKKEEQIQLIKEYIEDRHHMYLEHGYTNTIYQTICDSYAHKRKGDMGTRKMRNQVIDLGIQHYTDNETNYYLSPDKGDEKIFLKIIDELNIAYTYYKQKNKKLPDLFLKIKDKYVIVEHKNMKERGGHQNNVIVEIKDFINETDPNVYYVSYLDGKQFEETFDINYDTNGTGKKDVTNQNFDDILTKNENSYILNSYGFNIFLKELLKCSN